MKKILAGAVLWLLALQLGWAEEANGQRFYIGASWGAVTMPGLNEDPSAMQLVAGYTLPTAMGLDPGRYRLAIEAGYIDVSDYDLDGAWVAPVVTRYLNSDLDLLLRLGYAAGDDAGLLAGVGIDYKLDKVLSVRLEYLARPDTAAAFIGLRYAPF